MKKILVIGLVILLIAALTAGFFVWRHTQTVIGRDRAVEIALADAGFTRAEVRDVDVDYEREHGRTCYEVSFEKGFTEYKYSIDARSGDILFGGVDD